MKRFFCALTAILYTCFALAIDLSAMQDDDIISQSAILMDADTGQILYEKNMDRRMYPASITKIMTALLAVENCKLDEVVTIQESTLADLAYDSSYIALTYGEELSVQDALYATMLASANDAANGLAEHVAGSIEEFVVMMNDKARELGCTGTVFNNVHGYSDPQHYTTAYDMAVITKYAIQNPTFLRFFGADLYEMPPTNLQEESRPFSNYQYMLLKTTRHYDPDVIGGKVGYTSESGHTMVTAAARNGRTLICVVLSSPYKYDKFTDTRKLLDYGFDEFVKFSLPDNGDNAASVPLVEDGRNVGEVTFSRPLGLSVLIHKDLDPDKIRMEMDVPGYFQSAEEVSGVWRATYPNNDTGMYAQMASVPLDYSISFSSAEDAENAALPTAAASPGSIKLSLFSRISVPFGLLLIVLGALVLVLLVIRQINLLRRKRRRQRRKRPQAVNGNYWDNYFKGKD